MIPDPSTAKSSLRQSGSGGPARDGTHEPSRPGHIHCAACDQIITPDQYATSSCWTDPSGVTVAAHNHCLTRLGEHELQLPPDPGEPDVAAHHRRGP